MKTLFCILLSISIASAVNYYVSISGDDANDGKSIDTPWKSLNMIRFTSAGDFVYIRGGTYTDQSFSGCQTADVFDRPITISAYNGEKVIITGKPAELTFFNLVHCSYVLDGLNFQDAGEGMLPMVILDHTDNSIVQNCNFANNPSSTNLLIRASNNVTVRSCTFDGAGVPAAAGIPYPEAADASNIYLEGATYVLIEDNFFQHGGHGACDIIDFSGVGSSHVIFRRNHVESHWGGGVYASRLSHTVLVEDNLILYAGQESGYPKTGILFSGENCIARRNVIANTGDDVPNADYCLSLYAFSFYGLVQNVRHARVYNNLMYKCGGTGIGINQKDLAAHEDSVLVNNIVYKEHVGGDYDPNWPAGNYTLTIDTYHVDVANRWGADNFAVGHARIQNNLLLHGDDNGDYPDIISLFWIETTTETWNLTYAQYLYPQVYIDNVNFNPGLKDPDNRDYTLKDGSLSIDAGAFLTVTVGSGSATSTITVDDAYYFMDGWTLIDGDVIIVGSNAPVQVKAVDYINKILTINTTISYNDGDKVSFQYNGNAPDLGPYEYGALVNPSSPFALPTPPVQTTPQEQSPGAPKPVISTAETLVVSMMICITIFAL